MAGEWIKMRADLLTSPKVVRIASALKSDRLRVIGGLLAIWSIFDAHSEDGKLPGYTPEALDESIGWRGFSRAVSGVEWLTISDDSLSVPRFDEHNGQSAKRRAQEAQRKRTERGQASASNADKLRSRVEKSREEGTSSETNVSGPVDQKPVNGHPAESKFPNCPQQRIVALYRERFPSACHPRQWDGANAVNLATRWRETCKRLNFESEAQGLEYFETLFAAVEQSDFLMGRVSSQGRAPFRLRLAWIAKKANFEKIVEGFYA